ncbi:MAG: HWE histidine kinase domain-containing protein [Hyphomicrobiales bacterium]|nr:HWE histidine kinase domain-containing protein [Hyphomicrobiales bacterium]
MDHENRRDTRCPYGDSLAEAVIASLRQPVLVLNESLAVEKVNPAFLRTFRTTVEGTIGQPIYDLGEGEWNIPPLRTLLEDILPRERSIDDFEMRHEFAQIAERIMLLNARRIGRRNLILLVIEDITERKEAQERQQMLMSELSHRVKNLLALVDSMASQTLAKSRSLKDFGEAFHGRIRTVARSHGRLFASEWTSADIEELVRETFDGCAIDAFRVDMDGERVILAPDHAMALNLTIHELCTNAVKYGALSVPTGRVRMRWSVEQRDGARWIRLEWRESGGPRVRQPRRKGYGTRLIETLCPYELAGEIDLQYRPDGLVCALAFPLE